MLSLTLKRLALAVPSLIGVIVVTFLLTRALPGDPAAYFAGPAATQEAIEQIRVKLGLDQPLYVQFVRYVQDLARGDLGTSLTTGQSVGYEIKTRLPASAEIRSEEHTSELQSRFDLVCRLLLEKKKKKKMFIYSYI